MADTELLDLIPFFERLSKVDNVYSLLRNSNAASQCSPTASVTMTNHGSNGAPTTAAAVPTRRTS